MQAEENTIEQANLLLKQIVGSVSGWLKNMHGLQDGPLKFYSVTTFEKCSAELLRDFYMDNQYRIKWDNIVIHHEQLQVDENSGTEIGRCIKKFPLLTPKEYILAWRVWEGKDKTFYCFTKVSRKIFFSHQARIHNCMFSLWLHLLN